MEAHIRKKFKIKRGSKSKSQDEQSNKKIDIEPSTSDQKENNENIFINIDESAKTNIVVTEQKSQNQQVIQETPHEVPESSKSNQITIDIPTQETSSTLTDSDELVTSSPDTLTKLTTASGAEVFLIGTAHFSQKSVQDVQNVIRKVKPSAVVLELCKERAFMLTLDEQSLLEQNRHLSFDKIRSAIAEKGVAQGLIYIIFIKMSANLTEKLGLAPGSEFRSGAAEARNIPGCGIVLGDRSLRVTIARAVASVSLWQKMKLIYSVLTSDVTITQEDVEKFKKKDMLEQMLEELGGEFPGFKRVLLDERNYYLAHSIYHWANNLITSTGPHKVVAIVGIGHVAGIVEHWGNTTNEEVMKLDETPKTSKTKRIVTKTIKYCSFALLIYVGYRIMVPANIQAAITEKIGL